MLEKFFEAPDEDELLQNKKSPIKSKQEESPSTEKLDSSSDGDDVVQADKFEDED